MVIPNRTSISNSRAKSWSIFCKYAEPPVSTTPPGILEINFDAFNSRFTKPAISFNRSSAISAMLRCKICFLALPAVLTGTVTSAGTNDAIAEPYLRLRGSIFRFEVRKNSFKSSLMDDAPIGNEEKYHNLPSLTTDTSVKSLPISTIATPSSISASLSNTDGRSVGLTHNPLNFISA